MKTYENLDQMTSQRFSRSQTSDEKDDLSDDNSDEDEGSDVDIVGDAKQFSL